MKIWDSVVIFTDYDRANPAMSIRGLLEGMHITVHIITMDCESHIQQFLSGSYPEADFVIFCTHGGCDDAGENYLQIPIWEITGQNELGQDEFEDITRKIGPNEIISSTAHPRKTFISNACHSGKEPLAKAFLNAGWCNYIGTDVTTEPSSTLVFLATLFSLMRTEDRDYQEERIKYSVKEAVTRARNIEEFSINGTRSFRSFHREDGL